MSLYSVPKYWQIKYLFVQILQGIGIRYFNFILKKNFTSILNRKFYGVKIPLHVYVLLE